MRRPVRTSVVAAVAAAVSLVGVGLAPAASASVTSGSSAYSAGANTGTGQLHASLQISGSLGNLLDNVLTPILNTDFAPLLNALQGTLNTTVAAALGPSGFATAGTPSDQYGTAPVAATDYTLPVPCTSTGTRPCYTTTPAASSLSAAPLANISVGVVDGYTQQVPKQADATNPIFAKAQVSNLSVNALPQTPGLPAMTSNLVTAGLISSDANCPNDGPTSAPAPNTPPSATASVDAVSVFGGAVTFSVTDGDFANLKVNGISYPDVESVPLTTFNGVTVQSFGASLMMTIPLTAAQLLTGLGLNASVISDLLSYLSSSDVALNVVIGPNASITSSTAQSWGLGVGLDLSGSIAFNLLGLVTATVTIPTGIAGGNLGNIADLRLAYANCRSGVNTPAIVPIVPPELV